MNWFSRDSIVYFWKPANEEQIKSAKKYLETNQEKQSVGIFNDVRSKENVIYTTYMVDDKKVELIYDTPESVKAMNDVLLI